MDKEELDEKANRLIYVKKTIAELEEEEIELKEELEPHVGSVEPLLMPDGMIYFYSEKIKNTFNRQQVLEFIEKKFGPEVARAVDILIAPKRNVWPKGSM